MVSRDLTPTVDLRRRALLTAALLFAAELFVIGSVFKHSIDFTCLENWPKWACQSASGTLVSIYCVIGALVLFGMLLPQPLRDLTGQAGQNARPLVMNFAGVLISLVPIAFLKEGAGNAVILPAFGFWVMGMSLLLIGLGLYLAPLGLWRRFLAEQWKVVLPVVVAGSAAPILATLIRPIWRLESVADATFSAVAWITRGLGYEVEAWPQDKVIGSEEFSISVAPQCSGVEGLALVTLFVTLYLALFRRDLDFPRAFLLFPIGWIASATFNVVRIAALLIIGLEGHPDLAVGGFHSHAGWLMFTLVALGVVWLANSLTFFQSDGREASVISQPPFFGDPAVAQILPFLVFMATALLSSTFSETPSLLYPLRALAVGAVLWLILPYLRSLPWHFDVLSATLGIAIGMLWIATGPVSDGPPPFYDLTGMALAVWIAARVIGTSLFVPILEELMFRSYIQGRIAPEGASMLRTALAIGITTALFAALHDRWVAAALAGLIFSALVVRSRNITDAILSHGLANLTIALWALATGAWHIL
jgi:exosortase E/protease (VPEID-CTERM system)